MKLLIFDFLFWIFYHDNWVLWMMKHSGALYFPKDLNIKLMILENCEGERLYFSLHLHERI